MGSLKNLGDFPDIQSFPGAHFEIEGEVPNTQCAEAVIEGTEGVTSTIFQTLVDPGKFAGYALNGKVLHITASVGGNTGDFGIGVHTDDELNLDADPGDGDPVTYHITDGAELELTRNEASFAAFIRAAGYAYTFKGGKLHTNISPGHLQPACSITWNPIT